MTRSLSEDLSGLKVGRLVALFRAGSIGRHIAWYCQCECGRRIRVLASNLKSRHSLSCGCLRTEINVHDITGVRFGRLSVLRQSGIDIRGDSLWRVRCDCGRLKTVNGRSLRQGNTKSCGCLASENLSEVRKQLDYKYYAEHRIKDLTGKVFQSLTVINTMYDPSAKARRRVKCKCRCICGKFIVVVAKDLKDGNTVSCGCWKNSRSINIAGKRVHNLLVLRKFFAVKDIRRGGHKEFWECRCKCGNLTVVRKDHLTRGMIKSCGCLKRSLLMKNIGMAFAYFTMRRMADIRAY